MVCGSLASPFSLQPHTHKKYHPADTHIPPYSTYTLYAFHTLLLLLTHFLSGIKNGVMVPIHKWRPMRPLRSPVAFLAIKEPPEGSCWVRLKAHQVLLIRTGEWVAGVAGAISAPSKTKWRKKKTCIKTVN